MFAYLYAMFVGRFFLQETNADANHFVGPPVPVMSLPLSNVGRKN
jgi:hypothetical protein